MLKIKLGVAIVSLFIISAHASALRGPNVHFDTDQAEIINKGTLVMFAHSVKDSVEDVRLYCHTDSRASEVHNALLAERRCLTTKEALQDLGVDARSFVIVGEDNPEVKETGKDVSGRMGINRRVEIYYELSEQEVTVITKEVVKRHRVTIAGGYAPSGVKNSVKIGPNKYKVREDFDFELGASYAIKPFIKGKLRWFNIGVSGYTNKSGFIHLGGDF